MEKEFCGLKMRGTISGTKLETTDSHAFDKTSEGHDTYVPLTML